VNEKFWGIFCLTVPFYLLMIAIAGWGVINIRNKDLAWELSELFWELSWWPFKSGVDFQRKPDWDKTTTRNGWILIASTAIITLCYSLYIFNLLSQRYGRSY
jgi:hypothetical protein